MKYYSLKKILKHEATYNVIIGERSNGKTFAVHEHAAKVFWETGGQLAVIRRWQDDYTGKRGSTMFDGIVNAGVISRITNGEWTGIYYFSSRWFFCRYEDGKRITMETPFAFGFAITSLSTIIRQRDDVKIFMLGNTVNKYCPYFKEMGLKHVDTMKQGDIDIYRYSDTRLLVAVEYCKPNGSAGKPSDFYFAFDNPKLNMITGGAWEIDVYPHCPCKYRPADIMFTYFIDFNGSLLQCEVVSSPEGYFTFIHEKTTPLKGNENGKDDNKDLIFSLTQWSHCRYRRMNIMKPEDELGNKIAWFFKHNRVFYQDNEVGEIVANYLKCCT